MRRALLGCTFILIAASAFAGAKITIRNADDPGVGLNDPTPATAVGGNSGATLGEQRLIALQQAADIWSRLIDSNVAIAQPPFPAGSASAAGSGAGTGVAVPEPTAIALLALATTIGSSWRRRLK